MCRDISGMLRGRRRVGWGGNKRGRGKQAERSGRVRSLSPPLLSLPIARGRVIACDLVTRCLCCGIVLLSVCDFIFFFSLLFFLFFFFFFSDLCASWPLSVI